MTTSDTPPWDESDPLDPGAFKSSAPKGRQYRSGKRAPDAVPNLTFMNVLLPSTFIKKSTHEEVTEWLVIGRAFPLESGGWKIILKQNLSVSGTLIVRNPLED